MSETEPKSNAPITVRLEPELADFVREIARATCNTPSGALRLCVRTAKSAGIKIGGHVLPVAEPELAGAH